MCVVQGLVYSYPTKSFQNPGKPKAVLMNKSNKSPLLWRVLSNKYSHEIVFANCRDRKGKVSVEMGFEKGEQSRPKILVYGPDDTRPILYEGSSYIICILRVLTACPRHFEI